jgi:hypothetical protein
MGVVSFTSRPIYLWGQSPCIHSVGVWVSPRALLDVLKICWPSRESRPLFLGFPAHSKVLKTDPFGTTIGVAWQILLAWVGGGLGQEWPCVRSLHIPRTQFRKMEKICVDASFSFFFLPLHHPNQWLFAYFFIHSIQVHWAIAQRI